eukprot:1926350-Alexandrium_andersonii.AAC.1
MSKPTPGSTQAVASWMLWRAKYVPRRTCSYSSGVSQSFGRPHRFPESRSGRGPGGPVCARDKVSQGAPMNTKS